MRCSVINLVVSIVYFGKGILFWIFVFKDCIGVKWEEVEVRESFLRRFIMFI